MKTTKLLSQLFAVVGLLMIFTVSGSAVCTGTNTGTWTTSAATYSKNNQTVQSDAADYYVITVVSAGTLNLTIINDDSTQDLTVNLYSDGTCGASIWTQPVTKRSSATHSENVTAGTYTVRLVGSSSSRDTDYDLSGSFTSSGSDYTTSNPRDFTKVNADTNIFGDLLVIGNQSLCWKNGGTECANPPSNASNNSYLQQNINKDPIAAAAGYVNSTSADLDLGADDVIVEAWLYWIGRIDGETNKRDLAKTVRLKVPGSNAYTTITSLTSKYNWMIDGNIFDYGGAANITSYVQSAGAGTYWVADLQATEMQNQGSGWSIAVIVRDTSTNTRTMKNISLYDGFLGVFDGSGVYPSSVTSTISGFRTPKSGTIDSNLIVFAGESDRGLNDSISITNSTGAVLLQDSLANTSNVQNGTISRNGANVTNRNPNYANTLGIDIDEIDTSSIMDYDQQSTDITVVSNGDRIFVAMYGFATQLYIPNLCYDYAYKQFDRYFTEDNNGSILPSIIGSGLYTAEPVTVELFFQNTENSDISFSNITVDIIDINSTQATYAPNSTYVINPGNVFPQQYNTITGIPVDDINSQDYFYIDYNLDLLSSNINMSLNANINYEIVFSDGSGTTSTIPYTTNMHSMSLCSALNFAYQPSYGNFNVENSILAQNQKYNLPTQTVGRAGDFAVTSYDPLNVNTRKGISTAVAVDLIDAGKYHGIEASCSEPDSALTPRIWLIFDNNQTSMPFDANTIATAIANGTISDQISGSGTPITSAAEFYGNARENTAFRVSFNKAGDDTGVIKLQPSNCTGQQVAPCVEVLNFPDLSQTDLGNGPGRCVQDIDGNPSNADTIPQNCGNAGAAGMDSVQLAVCMECLYGYNIDFYCSRDNFATRPESFRMTLNDQNQTDTTQQNFIAKNDDITSTHTSSSAINVVAGYTYGLDINATNYQNEDSSLGYFASFLPDGEGGDRSIRFDWFASGNDAACNDTGDQNQTTDFFNGVANVQLISQQIGKYNLTLLDKKWTKVDWDTNSMAHHFNGSYAAYFLQGADCRQNSSVVPVEDSTTATYLDDTSGCDITTNNESLTPSYHTNLPNSTYYTDLALFVYPYTFNHASLLPTVGPNTRTNGQNFVYMDTPPLIDTDNKNMSYNMNGTFYASGYNGVQLSNFVTGCYAEDINMSLSYIYNTPNQNEAPYLWYSLKDHNTTDTNVIYNTLEINTGDNFARPVEPTEGISPLNIIQDDTYFAKEMSGAMTMDLGYNFKREMNKPINPRDITFNDFTLSYQTIPNGVYADMTNNYQIKEVKTLDTNVNFVYGRAKPSQYLYDDILANQVLTPISTVIYCEHGSVDCSAVYGLPTLNALTDEFDWYLSLGHVMTPDGDGNITLTATNGGTVTSPVSINGSNGLDTNVIVTDGGQAHPLDVDINFDTGTDRWLIFNPDKNDSNPNPFYRVRFIGQSGWAGHGDTGHVVDNNVSTKKNRRLGW